jgi:hypothetical protein
MSRMVCATSAIALSYGGQAAWTGPAKIAIANAESGTIARCMGSL